jgi:hypothetical protein
MLAEFPPLLDSPRMSFIASLGDRPHTLCSPSQPSGVIEGHWVCGSSLQLLRPQEDLVRGTPLHTKDLRHKGHFPKAKSAGSHEVRIVSLRIPFSHGRHLRSELTGALGDDASTDPVQKEEDDDGASKLTAEEYQQALKKIRAAID